MDRMTRKNIRLANYDYSSNGLYFITVCSKNRIHYFSEITEDTTYVGADIIRPKVILTDIGKIVDYSINDIKNHYENISVLKYCIMPDHVHLILSIMNDIYTADSGRIISAPTVSTVIGSLKRFVSKETGISIWQKSYHDHIIRNESEFLEICNYLDNNPMNWVNDIYNQNFWR